MSDNRAPSVRIICKYCLVHDTIHSCFPLYPQMVHPAKDSDLAFGTSERMHEFGFEI